MLGLFTATGRTKSDVGGSSSLEKSNPAPSRDLSVHGERKDVNTIFIKLRIADSAGSFYFLPPNCHVLYLIALSWYFK